MNKTAKIPWVGYLTWVAIFAGGPNVILVALYCLNLMYMSRLFSSDEHYLGPKLFGVSLVVDLLSILPAFLFFIEFEGSVLLIWLGRMICISISTIHFLAATAIIALGPAAIQMMVELSKVSAK